MELLKQIDSEILNTLRDRGIKENSPEAEAIAREILEKHGALFYNSRGKKGVIPLINPIPFNFVMFFRAHYLKFYAIRKKSSGSFT